MEMTKPEYFQSLRDSQPGWLNEALDEPEAFEHKVLDFFSTGKGRAINPASLQMEELKVSCEWLKSLREDDEVRPNGLAPAWIHAWCAEFLPGIPPQGDNLVEYFTVHLTEGRVVLNTLISSAKTFSGLTMAGQGQEDPGNVQRGLEFATIVSADILTFYVCLMAAMTMDFAEVLDQLADEG